MIVQFTLPTPVRRIGGLFRESSALLEYTDKRDKLLLLRFDYSVDIAPSASEIFFESFSSSSFDLVY